MTYMTYIHTWHTYIDTYIYMTYTHTHTYDIPADVVERSASTKRLDISLNESPPTTKRRITNQKIHNRRIVATIYVVAL